MDDLAYGKRNKRGDWTPSAYSHHRPRLRAPAAAARFSEMASWLFSALEPAVRRVRSRLCGFRASGCRSHEDLGLGLGPQALRRQLRRGVPVLQRLRIPALHVAGSRKPLQVPRQISQRPEEHAPSCSAARTLRASSGDLERACRSGRPTRSGSSTPSPMATRPGSRSRSIRSISDALRCSCRSSTSSTSFASTG